MRHIFGVAHIFYLAARSKFVRLVFYTQNSVKCHHENSLVNPELFINLIQ